MIAFGTALPSTYYKDYIPPQKLKLIPSILLKSLSNLHKRSVTLSVHLWLFACFVGRTTYAKPNN